MPGKQTQRGDAARAYSLGFELVCAVAGFVLVGIWIDRHYGSGPWGTLICLFLGLIGGFYNLIRGAARLSGGLRPGVRGGAASAPGMERQATRSPAAEHAGPGAPDPQPDHQAGSGSDGASPRTAEPWRAARSGGDDRRP
jgi:putative F0F1-ATPase subunit (Ca2+/Mg2+ transporter)